MIIKTVGIDEIEYEEKDPQDLLESIAKRGVAIPIQVIQKDSGYICVDGNKRLTACHQLAQSQEKFKKVAVVILNDYSKAGSSFWGNTQNRH